MALAAVRDLRELRAPASEEELERLVAGWRQDLATCRKFAPTARNYAVARLVPLINAADVSLRWFIEDVWGHFDTAIRPGAPLFPSERKNADGSAGRVTADVFRRSLAEAAEKHLPTWSDKLTPHVLGHFCASQLYQAGMSLLAIQELLGHAWTGHNRPVYPRSPNPCRGLLDARPAAGGRLMEGTELMKGNLRLAAARACFLNRR
ncbi:tyrosine-type recombinase/integrase, partial [Nocardiopsis gilva]